MRILIVAATEAEILSSIPFLNEHQIPYLVTGVGMVSTAFVLGDHLSKNHYDLLVNVGIAGCFDDNQPLGKLFSVNRDTIFNFGAQDGEHIIPIEKMGFGQSVFYSKPPQAPLSQSYYALDTASAITVNMVHGNRQVIEKLKPSFEHTTLESMEGAAFYFAALKAGTPAIQVRAISNYVESRNTENWKIGDAIANLNEWLKKFLEELP